MQTNGYAVTGLLGADTVTGVTGLGTGTNVGTYTDVITGVTGSGVSNYTVTYTNGALTLTPVPLVVSGNNGSSTYNGGPQTNGYAVTGLLGADTVTGVTGLGTGTNVGTYTDVITGVTGSGVSNYTVTYTNGALTLTPVPLIVSGNNGSSNYNGGPQTNGYTTNGLQGNDTVTGVNGLGNGTTPGTYNDSLGGATGNGLSNYTITYTNGALRVIDPTVAVQPMIGTTVYEFNQGTGMTLVDGGHVQSLQTDPNMPSDVNSGIFLIDGGLNSGSTTFVDATSGDLSL